MLSKLNYISPKDINDTEKVTRAIKKFQTKELAPIQEEWYKKRKAGVLNIVDKKNLMIQYKNLTDGAIDPDGAVLDILYFMTYMNNQIPKL
ncbi:MAG: hypothetical protein NW226_22930 [Microscillaceae bacterium]|nr:hypothetical protein [Microscillaceae bacterium]